MGRGFPAESPLIGSKLYEGDAFGGFVIYDDYGGSGEQGVTIRSVVIDGKQVGARDLSPLDVDSRTSEMARGWPRGSLNKRMRGCVSDTYFLENTQEVHMWGEYSDAQAEEPEDAADNRRNLSERRRRREVK